MKFQSSPIYASDEYEQRKTPPVNHSNNQTRDENITYGTIKQPFSTYNTQPPIYNTILEQTPYSAQNGQINVQDVRATGNRPDYLEFERNTLDYRIFNPADNKNVEFRNKTGSKNPEYRHSGSDFMTSSSEFSANGPTSIASTATLNRGTSTLNKIRNNRNHIITDTIPGPESCV